MTPRSISIPRIAIGTSVIAASTLVHAANGETCVSSIETIVQDQTVVASYSHRYDHDIDEQEVVLEGNSLTFPVEEEWSEEKHKPELKRLIVKKASSKSGLSSREEKRLAELQRMRRDSIPFSTSYETFIRERERLAELKKLTDALIAYERKYGRVSNG